MEKKTKQTYVQGKTLELISATKIAVDILITTLKETFDFEDTSDASKLKSFTESKNIAFKSAKELILEIERLEKSLERGETDLEEKEFNSNFLEESATNVK